MASLRKRNGKWQAQVRLNGTHLSRSFQLKQDALSWARETERSIERNGLVRPVEDLKQIPLKSLVARYCAEVLTSRKSGEIETIILRAFSRDPIASLSLATLTPQHFATYRDKRLKAVKPVTIARELAVLQSVYRVAMDEWGVPLTENPIRRVRKPGPGPARERRLQPEEVDKLFAAARQARVDYLEPIIRLAIETAMRRGEILRMEGAHIHPDQRLLDIPITKNGRPRTIPLTKEAVRIIQDWRMTHDTNDRFFPISANALRLTWERTTKRAGIEDLHFHDLRHEAISRFFEMGLSMPEVALISGHRDHRMLMRYTHLKPARIAERFQDFLQQI